MAGDETPEYLDDSKHVAYVSLGAVLRLDDSLFELLDAPVGAAYVRDAAPIGLKKRNGKADTRL
jgi:hypothetical protein